MSEMLPDVDYSRIRVHDKTQHGGFEQLCVDLFARKYDIYRGLVRVNGAGGDGGVEAYLAVPGVGKVGMQAKYFDTLGSSQWSQIRKSVVSALKNHPDLREYHIYVSYDRSPWQVNEWYGKISEWDKLLDGKNVVFTWHGKHEVSLELKSGSNADLLWYWFGTQTFDDGWMDRNLETSIQNLNARYQAERHIDAEITRHLERFAWTPSYREEIEQAFVEVADSAEKFLKTLSSTKDTSLKDNECKSLCMVIDQIESASYPLYGHRSVKSVLTVMKNAGQEAMRIALLLHDNLSKGKKASEDWTTTLYRDLQGFTAEIRKWIDFLNGVEITDRHLLLVTGEAGNGKSHLLAHVAQAARNRKQPALLLLGEQFRTGHTPLVQICEIVQWNQSGNTLLNALNAAGALAGRPALILIDALNESDDRRLWKSHLYALANEVKRFSHVRLIVSCRSGFMRLTLPDNIQKQPDYFAHIEHHGLGDVLFELIELYFRSYRVQSEHFPPLLDEFRNPLFLDTFCRAYEGQALPSSPITLKSVMEKLVERVGIKIAHDIDCYEDQVRDSVSGVAKLIGRNGGRAVARAEAKDVVDSFSPSSERSKSLYSHLVSNSILIETKRWQGESHTDMVRFAFERFSDYFIADEMLKDAADIEQFRADFKLGKKLSWLNQQTDYYGTRGVARALAILVPEKFGVELVQLLTDTDHRENVLQDFLGSLPWRSSSSLTKKTREAMKEAAKYDPDGLLGALLRVSTVPDHPLNANYLHDRLTHMKLPHRENAWTIPIGWMSADVDTLPSTIVSWALRVDRELVSDEQAALVAKVLLWFGSSNRVAFRSRASHAAIRVMTGRPKLMAKLVEMFDGVDDPYVVERLYAVACGVAMREPFGEGLRTLASVVHQLVFDQASVRPHALLRDYAQCLLGVAEHRGCLDIGIESSSFRPPFISKKPRVIGGKKAKEIAGTEGWDQIASSLKPESSGWYGDFGRYVMGSKIHRFLSIEKHKPIPDGSRRHHYDDKRAYRWILQRVKKLGWSKDRFGYFDGRRHDSDRMTDVEFKFERIGKKYQWIALHELLGHLSDHYHMEPSYWDNEPPKYCGAWDLSVRDFDPSGQARYSSDEYNDSESLTLGENWEGEYAQPYVGPFVDVDLLKTRKDWVETCPSDPINLLTIKVPQLSQNDQWVVLDGFWRWNESRLFQFENKLPGRAKSWVHARSWLVAEADADIFLEHLRSLHLWGHGCDGISLHGAWVGEYPYSLSCQEAKQACEANDRYVEGVGVKHIRTACDWYAKGSLHVPSPQMCEILGAYWSGEGSTFIDGEEAVVALQPQVPDTSDSLPCAVRRDKLFDALSRKNLRIVWGVVGERNCFDSHAREHVGGIETQISGVYTLKQEGIIGNITRHEVIDFEEKRRAAEDRLRNPIPIDDHLQELLDMMDSASVSVDE